MKSFLKKILVVMFAFALTFGLSVSIINIVKAIDTNKCGNNVYWKVENGTLTIYGEGAMNDMEEESQPYIDYLDEVTAIVVEEGVTTISKNAFNTPYDFLESVSRVKKLTLPSTITSIGDYAFKGLDCISEVNLPEGLKSIGVEAFYGCNSLQNVVLPESLEDLGAKAFKYCTSLKSIVIGSNVKEIKNETFYFDHDLEIVKFKDKTPTVIGNSVFNWTATEFYVPKGTRNAYAQALDVDRSYVHEYNIYKVTLVLDTKDNGTTAVVQDYDFGDNPSDLIYYYEAGDVVTITAEPFTTKDGDYKVKSAKYTIGSKTYNINKNSDDDYTFKMPSGDVTVRVEYDETDELLFNRYRNTKAGNIKVYIGEDGKEFEPSTKAQEFLDQANKDILALTYKGLDDKGYKTLDEKKAEVDKIYDLAANKAQFQDYKEELQDGLEKLKLATDSEATKKIANDAKDDLDKLAYDESKTLEQNKAAADEIVKPIADAMQLQRDKEAFDAYKQQLKDNLDKVTYSTDSAATKKYATDAKSKLDALKYDESKTLAQNKAAADAIVKGVPEAMQLQRDKEAFDAKKAELKEKLNKEIKSDDSSTTKSIAANGITALNKIKFDENLDPRSKNIDALQNCYDEYQNKIKIQRWKEAFEEYRKQVIANASACSQNGDSAAATKIITDAVASLKAVKFDTTKDLDANKKALDNIYDAILPALNVQRFNDYRTSLKSKLDSYLVSTDSNATKKIVTDIKSALDAVNYDHSKSLDVNKAALDALMKDVQVKLDNQRFEDYKTALKAELNGKKLANDSEKTLNILAEGIKIIDAAKFDKTKTLTQNKDALYNKVKNVPSAMQLQRDKEAFDAYKTTLKGNLDKVTYSTDSAATKKYATDAKSKLDALKYDEAKTLAQNKAAADAIVKGVPEAMQLQRDKEAYGEYQTAAKTTLDKVLVAGDSQTTKGIINTAKNNVDNKSYDETKTLAQNKANIDAIVNKAKEDVEKQRNHEAFDAYKVELANSINNARKTDDSNATKKIGDDAITALNQLNYDDAKTLAKNKEAADEVVKGIVEAMQLQRDKEAFAEHKAELKDIIDTYCQVHDSNATLKIAEDAKTALDNLVYDETLTLERNNEIADEIWQPVEQAMQDQRNLEAFNDHKVEDKNELSGNQLPSDSEDVTNIFNNAVKKINNLKYNKNKSLEENNEAIDEIVRQALEDVDKQRKLDDFNNNKQEKLNSLEEMKTPDEEQNVRDIFEQYINQINETEYDSEDTLENNKKVVDDLYEEAVKAIELQRQKNEFERYRDQQQKEVEKQKENKVIPEETQKTLNDLQKLIDEYVYDESKTLEENENAINTYYQQMIDILKEIPVMLEGDKEEYVTQSDEKQVYFRSSAEIDEFIEVRINNEVVSPNNYDVKEGSTIIELHQDYVNTLDPGTYTLDIVSTSGTATGEFIITEQPKTFPWETVLGVGIPAAVVLAMVAIFTAKKKDKIVEEQAEQTAE